MAYDNPIPGFGTNNVTNLRLFESQPINEFNLDFFNEGNFDEVSKFRTLKPEHITACFIC